MFVSNKGKFILIANPKTGTTSFRNMMQDNFDFTSLGGHAGSTDPIPKNYEGYTIIMIHRNPYDRFLSRWFSVKTDVKEYHNTTPIDFFNLYIKGTTKLDMCHIIPQSRYIVNKKIDFLIPFDNVSEELKKIPQLKEINFEDYQYGVFGGGNKKEFLTPELIELINDYYDEDFKNFGYEKR